jgi:acetyl-CoA carboxylase biotin carboxyl carrier protein
MNKKSIESIFDLIESNKERVDRLGISELEVKEDGFSIKVKFQSDQVMVAAPVNMHGPASIPPATSLPETAAAEVSGHAILSPMVGTVYLTPSPDAAPFVKIGQRVSVGDTICLVEAMKMFNKITADRAGVVKEILVTSGQAVDYDQSLIVIESV